MTDSQAALDIIDRPLTELLSDRYLSYALSTIMARSLPDVRDGLKPVHRRLLYAMRLLNLGYASAPKKCARVVGDVIGKFHPHGDAAVYEALVRLAQDFAVRYPLIDGQGNFGNIDGDNAAAMRYTESRLTEVAERMLDGIDEDAIDFIATYDGEGDEPTVLPADFPNLLANGSQGIAVGMATSIPPHNVAEICDALTALIDQPAIALEDLVNHMPGPDFPTGGVLMESGASIREAYATGRGSFRVRARWEVERLAQGQYQIVVTEIPYQVQKSRLIEKIAELLSARKLPMLDDVRDESTDDVRVVLVPRSRNVEPEHLMESLFRATDMESRISLNMNVLDGGVVPRVMTLKEVLRAFLDHRHEVLVRRTRHRIGKIDHRLEVLEGYLVAYLNLDEVIRIIRFEDEPRAELISRFDLTEVQADAILNMRLRALHKLQEIEIRREHDGLTAERAELADLLDNEGLRWQRLREQIQDMRTAFGPETDLGRRRTTIGDAPALTEVPLEAMVEREPVTILVSRKGWVRAVKGHQSDPAEFRYKEGDEARFALLAETTDKLLVFTTNGRFYTLGVDRLPRGRGYGEPLRLMIDLDNDADIVAVRRHTPGQRLLLAASDGRGFLVREDEVVAQTKQGKQVLNPGAGASASLCIPAEGDHVAIIGTNRKLLVFALEEVPEMARGRGVILQRYKDGRLADAKVFTLDEGLTWKRGEQTRTETDLRGWLGKRASVGRLPPNGFPKANRFG